MTYLGQNPRSTPALVPQCRVLLMWPRHPCTVQVVATSTPRRLSWCQPT